MELMQEVLKELNNELGDSDSEEKQETQPCNVLTGKDFEKLTKKAKKLGAESLDYSSRKSNKYMVTLPDGKKSILVHSNIQIILFMRIVLEKRDISHEQ